MITEKKVQINSLHSAIMRLSVCQTNESLKELFGLQWSGPAFLLPNTFNELRCKQKLKFTIIFT